MNLTERLTVAGYRAGWSMIARMPERAAYALFDRAADVMVRRGGASIDRMRHNYAIVRPELSPGELDELVDAGVRSYLRYFCDAFRLPAITGDDLDARIRLVGDELPRRLAADRMPIVLFLGHMGNWDLCGAWSTSHFAKVTTVAERLRPEELFTRFVAYRESLGMKILPLTGAGSPYPELVRSLEDGGFVPLLADRDLTRRGISVQLCGHQARVATGPAQLALRTGAALFPLAVHYEPVEGKPWQRVVASFGPRVAVPGDGTDRERVRAMTQQCADFLGDAITAHTEDWHMMQKVFSQSLSAHRAGATAS